VAHTTASAPSAASGPEAGERKKIGFVPCLAFAVGAMVGGGVFTLSGEAINDAGPAALVSYAIAGLVMLVSALAFVAVAARAEEGDSGYGPIAGLLGRPARFVVMWGFYLNALFLVAFLADSFGSYLHDYFLHGFGATAAGIACIGLLVLLNLGPAALVGKAETWVVGIKIGLLLVFIAWGVAALDGAHFKPFNPHGGHAIVATSALLFTAYTGFNVVTNMAPLVRDPAKTVPRAVIGAVLIATVIYLLVVVAMLDSGIAHFGSSGVSEAADVLMGHWGGQLIAFAACLSTLSGANAMILGGSEIALRLVVQRDIPEAVARRTPAGFPWMSVGLVGVVALFLVLFSSLDLVVAMSNVVALIAMIVVNAACVVLARRGWPGAGLRLPGGPLIPVVAGVACAVQFASFDLADIGWGVLAMAFGLLLYAFRHRGVVADGVLDEIGEALEHLETPLARALDVRVFHRKPHPEGST